MTGLQRGRSAELIVEAAEGRPARRGSGYRVTTTAVLTAAHLVANAARIRVRFNADLPGEWSVTGTVEFADTATDIAVVSIVPNDSEEHVAPTQFGRVGERAAVITCMMVGFPRFKLRADPPGSNDAGLYRDSHQADGRIATLSNWREGTLEIVVAPPSPDPDLSHSPWEGMSGAAVWSDDRIIGLVSEHFPRDGLNRLAATRTDRWYTRAAPENLKRLRELTGMPAAASELPDVIPPGSAEAVAADYTEQVEAIAPEELLGRDTELTQIAAFCASNESYQWWRADPWAGKTALAAWLVLHPPIGVVTVSFFVTSRLSGQSDGTAFTEAMIQQLAIVAGEPVSVAATVAARDGQRRRLLKQAAFRVQERGQQLLLVIDGLDEDTGVPPAGASSIASLLPERPPDGVHVLVTSRPHPGVPIDLLGKHPLRSCTVRNLSRSPYAEHLEIEAKRELVQHLRGADQLQVDIIGFIAAAGGGLALRELVELTNASQPKLEAQLSGVFGRTLSVRGARDGQPGRAEELYLFAHETLRQLADEQLAYDMEHYRQRLYEWADQYRDMGWPDSTPRYLTRSYAQMLTATGELARLAAIAIDRERHDLMLRRMLGDAAGLTEIADSQQMHLNQPMPDLIGLTHLAIEQDRLIGRNQALPHGLPALWARLGQADRGVALAQSITDPWHQAKALARLAVALGQADEFDRAEQVARSISSPGPQVWVLAQLAAAHIKGGRLDSAGRIVRDAQLVASTITSSIVQADALCELATAIGGTDQHEEFLRLFEDAMQVAGQIDDKSVTLARMAKELVAISQLDRALRLARQISDLQQKTAVLVQLAPALVAADRYDEAQHLVAYLPEPAEQYRVLDQVAAAVSARLSAASRWDEALKAISDINDHAVKVKALVRLAAALAADDRPEDAQEVMVSAERATVGAVYQERRAEALAELASALAASGRADHAERLADGIEDATLRGRLLIRLAVSLATSGDSDRAERVSASISSSALRADALARLASVFISTGELGRAERAALECEHAARGVRTTAVGTNVLRNLCATLAVARELWPAERAAQAIADPASRASALGQLAAAFADAGRPDDAQRAAQSAEQATRAIADPASRASALGQLAAAFADAGRPDDAQRAAQSAEQATRAIADPASHALALAQLTRVMATCGLRGVAEKLAPNAERAVKEIVDPSTHAYVVAMRTAATAAAGQFAAAAKLADDAEKAITAIPDPTMRSYVRARFAAAMAEAGQLDPAGDAVSSVLAAVALDSTLGPPLQIRQIAALAAAGQFDMAGRLAQHSSGPALRAWSFAQLAVAAAGKGRGYRARRFGAAAERAAAQIIDPLLRIDVQVGLTTAFVAAGQRDRARRAVSDAGQAMSAITNPFSRPRALSRLAVALADSGQREQAKRVASDAERALRGIVPKEPRALALVAIAFARSGQHDQVKRIAEQAMNDILSDTDRTQLAALLCGTGQLDLAERLTAGITSPVLQAEAIGRIATVLAGSGQLDLAERVVASISDPARRAAVMARLAGVLHGLAMPDLARKVAARIKDPRPPAEMILELCLANIGMGDLSRAEHFAHEAEQAAVDAGSPWRRAQVRIEVACAYLAIGQLSRAGQEAAEASKAAADVPDIYQQAEMLTRLAGELAEAGLLGDAERVAAGISDPALRAMAFMRLYSADSTRHQQADVKKFAQNSEIAAHEVSDPWLRASVLVRHAVALAASGQQAGAELAARDAEQAMDQVAAEAQRAEFLTALGCATASPKWLNRAEQAAIEVGDPRLLARLVVAYATHGQPERAAELAAEIGRTVAGIRSSAQQAQVLHEIGEQLREAELSDLPPQFRQLCGQVLTGPYWHEALPMVCWLDPHSFAATIGALTGQDQAGPTSRSTKSLTPGLGHDY